MIPKPTAAVPRGDDDRLTVLSFDRGNDCKWSIETFFLRGSVCWPIMLPHTEKVQGALLLLGMHVLTRKVYVFEELQFSVVSNVLGSQGEVQYPGLAKPFAQWWTTYAAMAYWYHQPAVTAATYVRQVRHDGLIQPQPMFLELDWQEDYVPMSHVFELGSTGRLFLPDGGLCQQSILKQVTAGDNYQEIADPVRHALMVGVYGMVSKMPRQERAV